MSLLVVVGVLVIVGVLLWAVQSLEFIAPPMKRLITIVVVVAVVLWLVGLFVPGLDLGAIRVGR